MQEFDGVVAVDGPSGSGKSAVCRRVAAELSAHYLDTGAMYRAVTFAVLRAGIDPADAKSVGAQARKVTLHVGTDPASPSIQVDTVNVDREIRSQEVTNAVSAVAAVPYVREQLVQQQRDIVAAACAGHGDRRGIVVEGRDIGKVVAPEALVKVYLTASAHARAACRHAELNGNGGNQEDTHADLARRDHLDSSRAVNPLAIAPDAIVLDTTEISIDEVVARILVLIDKARGGQQ